MAAGQQQHSIPPQHCLRCKQLMNSAGAPEDVKVAPFPGCRTVCIRCGEVMVFDEAMQLRLLTQAEYDQLPEREKDDIEKLHRIIGLLQRRN